MRKHLHLFALLAMAASLASAQAPNNDPKAPDAQAKVLVMPLPAFEDYVEITPQYRLFQIETNSGQNLLLPLLARLKAFKPTILVLAWPNGDTADLRRNYQAYANQTRALTPTAVEQIGFRLARETGIQHIVAIDAATLPGSLPAPAARDALDSVAKLLAASKRALETWNEQSTVRLEGDASLVRNRISAKDRVLIICPLTVGGPLRHLLEQDKRLQFLSFDDIAVPASLED
jgi:hypothetical protein